MFTGIVEDVGRVVAAEEGHLTVSSRKIASDAGLGDSIAVSGVDLTVTGMLGNELAFDAMPETYRRSNLADLGAGDFVNLERSVRATDRLSGHIVRGVVEGIGQLEAIRAEDAAVIHTYRAPAELLRFVLVKGPICVDGVSLTVIDRTCDAFAVSIVQYTQGHTISLRRRLGDRVNLETDILGRYVDQLLKGERTTRFREG